MRSQKSAISYQLSVVWAVCVLLLSGCETQMYTFVLPTVETKAATNIKSDSVELNAVFAYDNIGGLYVRRAFELSDNAGSLGNSNTLYYVDDDWRELIGTDEQSLLVTGLSASTDYYYRAVLIPKDGTLSAPIYGDVWELKTTGGSTPPTPPTPEIKVTIVTKDVRSVTSTTARLYGECSVENGTLKEMGLVASSYTNPPTIGTNSGRARFSNVTTFSTFYYNLSPGVTYYVRAYAIDSDDNVYYGETKSFVTKTEPGGSKTVDDYIGTYTVTATSPWEGKTVTWDDVQIIPYNGDTVVAVGWENRDELRAVGIFDKGLQVVRFESGWCFEIYSFDVDGKTCAAQFMPIWYDSSSSKAYLLSDGGKALRGEVWLKVNESGNVLYFGAADGDSDEGYYANGFIFDYYALADWTKQGNSQAYTNVQMTRTSTTTWRYMPAGRVHLKSLNGNESKMLHISSDVMSAER